MFLPELLLSVQPRSVLAEYTDLVEANHTLFFGQVAYSEILEMCGDNDVDWGLTAGGSSDRFAGESCMDLAEARDDDSNDISCGSIGRVVVLGS